MYVVWFVVLARKLYVIPGLEMEALWCIADQFGTEKQLKKSYDKQLNEKQKEQYLCGLTPSDIKDRFRDWDQWFMHGIKKYGMDSELSAMLIFLRSNEHEPESPIDAILSKTIYHFFCK